MPRGSLAELLKSRANLGEDSNPGSPLYPANTRNSTDKAAYELGYRTTAAGSMGEVSQTLHSIKGSVKDIAVAGKEKVQKSLGQRESSSSTPPYSAFHSRSESYKCYQTHPSSIAISCGCSESSSPNAG
eukprot:jgi/Picre1/34320/NNA_001793.t1